MANHAHTRGSLPLGGPKLGSLIASLGTPGFPEMLHACIQAVLPVDASSAFLIGAGPNGPARCLLAASRSDLAGAQRSAERYASEFWRHDPSIRSDERSPGPIGGATSLVRLSWDAIRYEPFRTECYVKPMMIERLSIVCTGADSTRLLLSVFRSRRTGFFTEQEGRRWGDAAPVFAACVTKHAELGRDGAPETARLGLSTREREVAGLLAAGLTLKAVSVQLGLAPSTVETFRKRIYGKLGVGNRVELLMLVQRQPDGAVPGSRDIRAGVSPLGN